MSEDFCSSSGTCSSCAKLMPIRRDGKVRVHGPVASRCPGSGLIPAVTSPPSPPVLPPTSSIGNGRSPDSEVLNPGRVNFKVIPRIPRAVRDQVARKLAEILDQTVSSNSREAWEQLFLFCRKNLHAPLRRGHRRSLASHVHRALSDDTIPTDSSRQPFQDTNNPLKNLAVRVAAKLEEGDFKGAVRVASSDVSFAPTNSTTLDPLRDKHPPPRQPYSNFVINGNVLQEARPYLFGASLVALNKSSGGIRPIAVGCVLRRLVAKCASSAIRDKMGSHLAPLQLGFGTHLGAEAAVHAARHFVHNLQPGHLLLKVDFRNAFSCLRRDKMLQSVLCQVPSLYRLVHSAYNQPSLLFFGNNIIES